MFAHLCYRNVIIASYGDGIVGELVHEQPALLKMT